jgi:hypothetical protein
MGLVCALRLLGWAIKYLDGGDLKNFMNALFGSAGDLIQGDRRKSVNFKNLKNWEALDSAIRHLAKSPSYKVHYCQLEGRKARREIEPLLVNNHPHGLEKSYYNGQSVVNSDLEIFLEYGLKDNDRHIFIKSGSVAKQLDTPVQQHVWDTTIRTALETDDHRTKARWYLLKKCCYGLVEDDSGYLLEMHEDAFEYVEVIDNAFVSKIEPISNYFGTEMKKRWG